MTPTPPMVHPNSLFDQRIRTTSYFGTGRAWRYLLLMAMKPVVGQQLHRTKLCSKFFSVGICRDSCTYAHSSKDLRDAPDMRFTKLCRSWKLGKCDSASCRYAHGADQLRSTKELYKTQKCAWFENGKCKYGDRCRHAHGGDMRQLPACDPPASGQLVYAI